MASKIQRLVSQARATFSKRGTEPAFSEEMKQLNEIMNSLTSEDFNLSQSVTQRPWNYLPYVQDSPASCMEVYQCPEFSLGIFLLKPNKVMPFHDHPNMHGVMKVLFNSMTVASYSKVEGQELPKEGVPVVSKFLSQVVLDTNSEPCVLYPNVGNIHQIQANEKAVAFLDILAPPYNPQEGRDCNYYEKVDENEEENTVRLMPGPNPSWFSCVPLSYNGPRPREPAHRFPSQIATLKANNTQLATALDELRRDYRKLQLDNLQLKRERHGLLEKVAKLEKRLTQRASKMSTSKCLQEAQCKLREVQTALEFVQKAAQTSLNNKHHLELKPQSSPRKVLRFSTPPQSEGCTIYPRTPHPLHNMTCVVDGPQLASTPVETTLSSSSSSLSVHLSPQKINYSDTVEDADITELGGSRSTTWKRGDQLGRNKEEEQWKMEPHASSNSTLDQLENALTCDRMTVNAHRPRRRCTSLSLSYQEPTLNRKLRRGDPFTEQMTDWNPPDQRERRKKKSGAIETRRALQDVQNQR